MLYCLIEHKFYYFSKFILSNMIYEKIRSAILSDFFYFRNSENWRKNYLAMGDPDAVFGL